MLTLRVLTLRVLETAGSEPAALTRPGWQSVLPGADPARVQRADARGRDFSATRPSQLFRGRRRRLRRAAANPFVSRGLTDYSPSANLVGSRTPTGPADADHSLFRTFPVSSIRMWRVSGVSMGISLMIGLGVLVAARRVTRPHAPDWLQRSMTWLMLAATVGSAVAAVAAIVMNIIGLRAELLTDPVNLLGGSAAAGAMMLVMYLFFAIVLFVPSYATIIVLAARFGPLLGRLETTWRGLVLLTGFLAIPAGAATAIFASTSWSPSGRSGVRLAALVVYVFAATWIGLLLARRVTPRLSPGTFAA